MAYMRGDPYLRSDGSELHLWAASGYDGWDESGWAEGRTLPHRTGSADPHDAPSGVAIAHESMDEYVLMRLAELVRDGTLGAVIARAMNRHAGNVGCEALRALGPTLRGALEPLAGGEPAA